MLIAPCIFEWGGGGQMDFMSVLGTVVCSTGEATGTWITGHLKPSRNTFYLLNRHLYPERCTIKKAGPAGTIWG